MDPMEKTTEKKKVAHADCAAEKSKMATQIKRLYRESACREGMICFQYIEKLKFPNFNGNFIIIINEIGVKKVMFIWINLVVRVNC